MTLLAHLKRWWHRLHRRRLQRWTRITSTHTPPRLYSDEYMRSLRDKRFF